MLSEKGLSFQQKYADAAVVTAGETGTEPSGAGPSRKGRARKRAEFSPYLAEMESSGLCEDADEDVPLMGRDEE